MLRKLPLLCANLKEINKVSTCFASSAACEVRIPVPWGHIAGKWWGPKDKAPIFTFHGWQDNCGSFDLLMPILPKHLSFLTVDFPGHGFSSKIPPGLFYHNLNGVMLIRRLQTYFNLEKVSLMGHSLGAITSYTYGGFYPQSVNFVICIDGLSPLINPKRLDRVTESIDAFLKYDQQVVNNLSGKVEPPAYSMETMIEMMHKGTRGSVDKDKCKYIITRNIKESKLKPGLFYFDRDPRLKSGPLMNWPMEDLLEHANRINFPILATKAESSPVLSNHGIIKTVREIISKQNPTAEFLAVAGKHHGHLNTPEIFADIIPKFIAKYENTQKDMDLKYFEAIKHVE
ncbi:probable serine hydrolase [Atheta coriaria]|uniref:probable serine hydrolase n=1 Tax=Dalotia coriaria TaxID=877792 RepID=UPI0031F34DEC